MEDIDMKHLNLLKSFLFAYLYTYIRRILKENFLYIFQDTKELVITFNKLLHVLILM